MTGDPSSDPVCKHNLGKSKDLINTNLITKAFKNHANVSTTTFCTTMNFKPGY